MAADLETYRPIRGGCAVNDENDNVGGTLGWFATLNSDGSVLLLTNKHVLYGDKLETTTESVKLGQHDFSGSLCCRCNYVADTVVGIRNDVVDCAIARLLPKFKNVRFAIGGTKSAPDEILVAGKNLTVTQGQPVKKVGIASGLTHGFIADPAARLIVRNSIQMNHQILIRPDPTDTYRTSDGKRTFNDEGDSGSVLLNANNEVIGLIHSNTKRPSDPNFAPEDPDPNILITIASRISDVLDAFSAANFAITLCQGVGGGSALHFAEPDPIEAVVDRFHAHPVARTPMGLAIRSHAKEIGWLINKNRAVTVAWHRNQGPAYMAALHRSVREPGFVIPREIGGVERVSSLLALGQALQRHGSEELGLFVQEYSPVLTRLFDSHDTLPAILDAAEANLTMQA